MTPVARRARTAGAMRYHFGRPMVDIPSYPTLIRFAVPVMLAAIATPLMGMVDTAVLGRLGDPAVIAAAGIGGTIFTVIYWCFAFLRFTTTALVSQAIGRADPREVLLAGLRPMLAAVMGGAGLWLLQWPIGWLALRLLSPPADVLPLAADYFYVRIWSAPLTLLGYAQFAWLMGQGRARTVMLLQVAMNALNAALASVYVLECHWGIAGAARATVTSEAVICVVTTGLMLRMVSFEQWLAVRSEVLAKTAWRTLFSANIDITIRTLLLTGAFALMTERGARLGLMDLAANQILLQAFLLVANLLDGFAIAAEVFGGRAIGLRNRAILVGIVRRSAALSLGWSLTLTTTLLMVKPWYVRVMTSNVSLQETASTYWPWVAFLPLVCIWAFLWDGVFMSAMRTRTLRNTMLLSVLLYVPALFVFSSIWGNHGIWAALFVLMAGRSVFLTVAWPSLKNTVGGHPALIALCVALGALAWPPTAARADDASPTPLYREARGSPDGIGKFYEGREIAEVMGFEGASWLERSSRTTEERPDLLVEELHLQPGMTVADIGAGSGYLSRRMAPLVTPGRVFAVDVQPPMVALLTELSQRPEYRNIVPIQGSAADVKLPPASVDLAIMVDVYHELAYPYEVMRSLIRALKPGGRMVFVEYRGEDPNVPIKELHKMSVAQIRREMRVMPLVWERTSERLPIQHIVVFRKVDHQPPLPVSPLKGPTSSGVIQPP